jgi:hypothetical protein
MIDEYTGKERREFLRYDCDKPIQFKIVDPAKKKAKKTNLISKIIGATSKNLSASGILFMSQLGRIPEIASLVVIDLDYRTVGICKEIEKRALILDNKIVGRVVRIEDNEDGTCDVGVAFVTRADSQSRELKKLVSVVKEK